MKLGEKYRDIETGEVFELVGIRDGIALLVHGVSKQEIDLESFKMLFREV